MADPLAGRPRKSVAPSPDARPPGAGRPPLLPPPSLPKGGGAIRGIGEKFTTNPVTGTASLAVPVFTSPGRSGFGPQLSLVYDSGSGNGPFGFGWSLSLPAITRKVAQGLPRYDDTLESDVFLISGAEDLVPLLNSSGERIADLTSAPGYLIQPYRPRIEGMFARIERWTDLVTGDVHWRSISRENVTSIYGQDQGSRIVDPEAAPSGPARIASWLICSSHDDKGNAIRYEYVAEDGASVDLARASERNRVRTANRYIKRIRYGNQVSRLLQPDLTQASWRFEVVFDYDEDHVEVLPADPGRPASEQRRLARAAIDSGNPWTERPDPFSSYRFGFELRTHRRCRRVLMFHRFPELGEEPCLVRSTEIDYADLPPGDSPSVDAELTHQGSTRFGSFLRSITQLGFVRDPLAGSVERQGVKYQTYLVRSYPPLELEYSRPQLREVVQDLEPESLANLPAGADGRSYQWVDLDGEGLAGILTRQAGTTFYKPNLGGGRFGPLRTLPALPSTLPPGDPQVQLLDLSGDGRLDLVGLRGRPPGFCERGEGPDWDTFRPFAQLPNLDWQDPNLRFVDLDGDGRTDVLIADSEAFTWYTSLGEDGFSGPQRTRPPREQERGPRLVFADGAEAIYLADLGGDGLTDLVRIRNGEICYWPNLGHGRFGAKVTMDNPPWFDHPDQFDRRRIQLADIDGSGTTDLIYVGRDGVQLYFNQAGNRWSDRRTLPGLPASTDLSFVAVADLLGTGTSCLVWSSSLPTDRGRPLRFVDLLDGRKPHLLVKTSNNLGIGTQIDYVSSTRFYLEDRLAGRPWRTRLPFPVHVVERVISEDAISGNRFSQRYAYHHGYFDGVEREFRGFAMVETWDTQEIPSLGGDPPPPASNLEPAAHLPPVWTRTWFHTGVYLGREQISNYFAGLLDSGDQGEYFREPGGSDAEARALLLPDTILPAGLTPDEEREACRALKGSMLRQEIYAADGTERAGLPYDISEQNFTVELLQPRGRNRNAVFFTHPREALRQHQEREPGDPRISHAITLAVDNYGNITRSLLIGYGRRAALDGPPYTPADRARQQLPAITYTEIQFTNPVTAAGHHRAPLPAQTRVFELTGFTPVGDATRFSFDEWSAGGFARIDSATEIPYQGEADRTRRERRLIEQVRTLYRRDDLTGLLPLGQAEPRALPGETYTLALTPTLVAAVFRRPVAGQPDEVLLEAPDALLEGQGPDQGGYVALDGAWWIPTGRVFYDPAVDPSTPGGTAAQELSTARAHFFLPRLVTDSFGHANQTDYDAADLLVARSIDALGNTVAASHDYRVLLPRRVTDPNRNRSEALFDGLGAVVATAVKGKEGEALGDRLEGIDPDPVLATVQAFLADPGSMAHGLLGDATTRTIYDLDAYRRSRLPPVTATISRETHLHDAGPAPTRVQMSFAHADGFGRELQRKVLAEPGPAPARAAPQVSPAGDRSPGPLLREPDGALLIVDASERWVGTGRTVFDNKGNPVRQWEPFFSVTHLHEPEPDVIETGVSRVRFYDPLSRPIATIYPDHTYEKTVFRPWSETTHDANDTAAPSALGSGDPRTDPDIAACVRRYFEAQPPAWQTWYDQRIGGDLGTAAQAAAVKASVHADTPTVSHLDVLGRVFLTVEQNQYQQAEMLVGESLTTRFDLDIEGNPRAIHDPRGRLVARYQYDLAGNRIRSHSLDSGERWVLADAAGKPIRSWDSRRFQRRLSYDQLRRPTGVLVIEPGGERLAERILYGEGQGDAKNHRTRVYQRSDGAGVLTSLDYDFKGNLRVSRRELLSPTQVPPDWGQDPVASDGTFITSTSFDALDRPLAVISPDGSRLEATFNQSNLLETVAITPPGAAAASPLVTDIEYDARGRRRRIRYGNGSVTEYGYDPVSLRLQQLRTTRPAISDTVALDLFATPTVVQDLRYVYDPVGNIVRVDDTALATVFLDGQPVPPRTDQTYDALYRLIEVTGREHATQTAFAPPPPDGNHRDFPFLGSRAGPNDLQAFRPYRERYRYDAAGNLEQLRHGDSDSGWTRHFEYDEDSSFGNGETSNRLTRTTLGDGSGGGEMYGHDDHGNLTSLPHLGALTWDFQDRLQTVDLGGGRTARYLYDSEGRRVRKIISDPAGKRRKERLYVGGFEVYREYEPNGVDVTLARESLSVLDDRQRIALVEAQTVDAGAPVAEPVPAFRYQIDDHLGTSCIELDADGRVISVEQYHPFGTTSFQTGPGAAEGSGKRYRYTGRERDEETGLSYHRTRYYAPWLGRWCAPDPLELIDGVNVYVYSRNRPTVLRDPEGTDAEGGSDPRNYKTFEQYRASNPHQPEDLARKVWDDSLKKKYLILYDSGDAEFKRQADQAAKDHATKAYSVKSSKLSALIQKEKPDVIINFGHGIPSSISVGETEWIGKATLGKQLKDAKQAQEIIFSAQACSAGSKDGLIDELSNDPDLARYKFVSHTTVRHVTRNSDLRFAGGDVLPRFLAAKAESTFRLDAQGAALVASDVLQVKDANKETLPNNPINLVIRELGVLGFEAFWSLITTSGDVSQVDAVKALNLTPEALGRFQVGIDEFRARLNASLDKNIKPLPGPIKVHQTEIR